MIFKRLGSISTQYRLPIILIWIALAVIITLVAPNIADVASSDQADILPGNAPYVHAEKIYEETFPAAFSPSSTIIVIDAQGVGGVLNMEADTPEGQTDTDVIRFVDEAMAWLNSDDAPDNLEAIIGPTISESALKLMVAPDNRTTFIRANITTSSMAEETVHALEAIDDWLIEHRPESVETYQTGMAPISYHTSESIITSVDRTIYVTVILVIIMLIIVYRSPVSPLIPLVVVTIAYLITRGIVAFLGENLITITSYANVLLVVVLYGAGTDYCLFLISRFREEMADNPDVKVSTARTVHRVGETITSSAGTIFVGFSAMVFSEMGIFKTTGPSMALGIVIVLLAGLTLVPALLSTLGNRAFWPGKATHRANGRWYEFTSRLVSSRPLLVVVAIVILMIPLSIYGIEQDISYDLLADMPDDKDSIVGVKLLEEGLGASNALPMTAIVTGRDVNETASQIIQLSNDLIALDGVDDIRSLNSPLGLFNGEFNNLLRVDMQLNMMTQAMAGFTSDEGGDIDLQQAMGMLQGISAYFDTLSETFPEIADDENLATIQELLANPLLIMQRQDDLAVALEGLAERFNPESENAVENPYLLPTAFADIIAGSAEMVEGNEEAGLLNTLISTYLAADGRAFKLDVIQSYGAVSPEAMDLMAEIRGVLAMYDVDDGDAVIAGTTAMNTDIRDTMNRDLLRAIGFVLAGIFIVLLVMLRSLVAPLYLIGTVLLSFTFTLGLTHIVFTTFFDVPGLTWYVPFFMFVFLVALGIDYSIFLFGRVKEEVGNHGLREGVHVAVATTGAIITSAGLILSGTFAAMMSGEIMGLSELGFAVSVGVLIDTFVVRTILDPALAALFGKWTWWPGGVPQNHGD